MPRDQIYQTTNCTCSIGVGHNSIMARIATKKHIINDFLMYRAKPNGLVYIPYQEQVQCLASLPVTILPGVGTALQNQLCQIGVTLCQDVLSVDKVVLP